MHNKVILSLAAMIVLAVVGCGKNVPMSGKVTFSDDQSPLTTGMVFFETDTFQSRGRLTPQGTYQLGSTGQKDGLPPGEYRVYVAGATVADPKAPSGANVPPLPLIDHKYASGMTSGLSVQVDRSTRTFSFSVDRNPTTAAKLKNAAK